MAILEGHQDDWGIFPYEKINNGATRCSGRSRIFKKEVSGFKTKKKSAQIRPSKVD